MKSHDTLLQELNHWYRHQPTSECAAILRALALADLKEELARGHTEHTIAPHSDHNKNSEQSKGKRTGA